MKKTYVLLAVTIMGIAALALAAFKMFAPSVKPGPPTAKSVYEFTLKNIEGQEVSLKQYEGKVLVIVNVASKCGLTPQYEGIEALYRQYKDQGVVVLGFPANNFMGQEPGTEEEIKTFCKSRYDVSFPMFSKISVKGDDQHPLYTYLTQATGEGVSWNFQKFIINRKGEVVKSISPRTKVDSPEFLAALKSVL